MILRLTKKKNPLTGVLYNGTPESKRSIEEMLKSINITYSLKSGSIWINDQALNEGQYVVINDSEFISEVCKKVAVVDKTYFDNNYKEII